MGGLRESAAKGRIVEKEWLRSALVGSRTWNPLGTFWMVIMIGGFLAEERLGCIPRG